MSAKRRRSVTGVPVRALLPRCARASTQRVGAAVLVGSYAYLRPVPSEAFLGKVGIRAGVAEGGRGSRTECWHGRCDERGASQSQGPAPRHRGRERAGEVVEEPLAHGVAATRRTFRSGISNLAVDAQLSLRHSKTDEFVVTNSRVVLLAALRLVLWAAQRHRARDGDGAQWAASDTLVARARPERCLDRGATSAADASSLAPRATLAVLARRRAGALAELAAGLVGAAAPPGCQRAATGAAKGRPRRDLLRTELRCRGVVIGRLRISAKRRRVVARGTRPAVLPRPGASASTLCVGAAFIVGRYAYVRPVPSDAFLGGERVRAVVAGSGRGAGTECRHARCDERGASQSQSSAPRHRRRERPSEVVEEALAHDVAANRCSSLAPRAARASTAAPPPTTADATRPSRSMRTPIGVPPAPKAFPAV